MAASLGRDTLILTVNQRLARHLLFKHSEKQKITGEKVWETPKTTDIKSWFKSQWFISNSDQFLLSEIQSIKIWESIILKYFKNKRSTDRKRILSKWTLLNIRSAAKRASEAYSLITEYRITISSDPLFLNKENELFLKWLKEYQLILRQNKAIDQAVLIDIIRDGMKNKITVVPEEIELYGFEEITPQLKIWLDFLRSQNKKVTLNPSTSGSHSLLNKDILKKKNIEIYSFNDLKDECRNCANWVRAISKKGQTIGIIVPQLEKYRRQLHKELTSNLTPKSIFPGENIEPPFEISLGTPLSKEGMIQVVFEVLSIQMNSSVDKLLNIINSPYIKSGRCNENERSKFQSKLVREGFLNVNIEHITTFLDQESPSELNRLLDLLIDLAKNNENQSPSLWTKLFSKILKNIGWMYGSEKSFSSREIQCLNSWNECLDDLASLDIFSEEILRHEIIKELQEITNKKLFQVKTKEQSIQVLDLFESTGMKFDKLWIMGCHSDCIPSKPNPNPFIPIDLQKQLQLPHSNFKQELKYTEQALSRLVSSSQSIIFSYPDWEQENKKQITPLLSFIPQTKTKFPYTKSYRVRDLIKPLDQIELWEDKLKIPPSHYEIEEFTTNGLRAGYKVIQNQADCSFKAFVANRLQADDFAFSVIDFDTRDRGILIHKVLQIFWQKHKTRSALQNLKSSNTLITELENATRISMKTTSSRIGKQSYFKKMEQDRTVSLLIRWMDQELLRPEFEVKFVEKNESIVIKKLKLNLRIDRIDLTPEKNKILIDYKTGAINSNSWFKDRMEDPQLPLYTLKSPSNGLAFANISKDNLKWISIYDPIISNPFPKQPNLKIPADLQVDIEWPNWNNLISFWKKNINKLADEFTLGEIVINPIKKNETCRNCGYSTLCRIGESASEENSREKRDD